MKKINTLTFLIVLALTSCKKDRICRCYAPEAPQAQIFPTSFYDTKKNAKKKCEDYEKKSQSNYFEVKCELE